MYGFLISLALLPSPIFDEEPLLVETYWKAWELAAENFHTPTPENGFVSPYIDAAFNDCVFMWDTAFMTMFCNYAHPLTPGIGSLDNFYAKQHPDGEICREIRREDGADNPLWVNHDREPLYSAWGYDVERGHEKTPIHYRGRQVPQPAPVHTLDNMNHPIMAWAEWESFHMTGDFDRLKKVYEPLKRQYEALKKYLRQGNGLYMTDWASMDNSPRNAYLKGGGTAIDTSCEMVMFAGILGSMAAVIAGHDHRPDYDGDDTDVYWAEATELKARINELMWDDETQFYYDLTLDGKRVNVKTVAAYWALVSEVASDEQARTLAAHLTDPATFGTPNRVPTLAAGEAGFSADGNYWCGAVWAPTTVMIIAGLERYGYRESAREIAMNHVRLVADVYKTTGTIWENYSPVHSAPGRHADGRDVERDFVGWSGLGPIKLFLEYGIGLRTDDILPNTLDWNIRSDKRIGCENFRWGGNVVSLVAPKGRNSKTITVTAEKPFRLIVGNNIFDVKKGQNKLKL